MLPIKSIQFGNTYHLLFEKSQLNTLDDAKQRSLQLGESYFQENFLPDLSGQNRDDVFTQFLEDAAPKRKDVHLALSTRGHLSELRIETPYPKNERIVDKRLLASMLEQFGLAPLQDSLLDAVSSNPLKDDEVVLNLSKQGVASIGTDILENPIKAVNSGLNGLNAQTIKQGLSLLECTPETIEQLKNTFLTCVYRAMPEAVEAFIDWGMPSDAKDWFGDGVLLKYLNSRDCPENNRTQVLAVLTTKAKPLFNQPMNDKGMMPLSLVNMWEGFNSKLDETNFKNVISATDFTQVGNPEYVLEHVVTRGNVRALEILMKPDGDILSFKYTPKHLSQALFKVIDMIQVQYFSKVPLVREHGKNQIMMYQGMALALINLGADVSVTNEQGKTLMEMFKDLEPRKRRRLGVLKKALKTKPTPKNSETPLRRSYVFEETEIY